MSKEEWWLLKYFWWNSYYTPKCVAPGIGIRPPHLNLGPQWCQSVRHLAGWHVSPTPPPPPPPPLKWKSMEDRLYYNSRFAWCPQVSSAPSWTWLIAFVRDAILKLKWFYNWPLIFTYVLFDAFWIVWHSLNDCFSVWLALYFVSLFVCTRVCIRIVCVWLLATAHTMNALSGCQPHRKVLVRIFLPPLAWNLFMTWSRKLTACSSSTNIFHLFEGRTAQSSYHISAWALPHTHLTIFWHRVGFKSLSLFSSSRKVPF